MGRQWQRILRFYERDCRDANVGQVHPAVKKKVEAQLSQLWHISNLFDIPQQEQWPNGSSSFLAPMPLSFATAVLKPTKRRSNWREIPADGSWATNRYEVITFQQSFHGRTLATLTATGQDKVKKGNPAVCRTDSCMLPYNDIEALEPGPIS